MPCFYSWIAILFFLCSCTLRPLDVQTQYLSHENLASAHVGTPDPRLDDPPIGQRLLIQWSLTKQEFDKQPLFLQLHARFRNHEEKTIKIPVRTRRGYFTYDLLNDEYFESGGIQTYLVEISYEDCIIAMWKHPLWTKLITFDSQPK